MAPVSGYYAVNTLFGAVSFASSTLDDPLPDTIPLSNAEKIRRIESEGKNH
jgi:hypothetical protein